MGIIGALLLVALVFGFYFLPTIIAHNRRHLNENPITIVNIFFGWTVVGWVVCLAWAFSNNVKEPT
jgi:hypothetical protein